MMKYDTLLRMLVAGFLVPTLSLLAGCAMKESSMGYQVTKSLTGVGNFDELKEFHSTPTPPEEVAEQRDNAISLIALMYATQPDGSVNPNMYEWAMQNPEEAREVTMNDSEETNVGEAEPD